MGGSIWRLAGVAWAASAIQTLAAPAGSPVDVHGFLHEADLKKNGHLTLVDQKNKPTQLVGMSMFWSGWSGQFYNRHTVGWLASDWNISVIRASIGVDGGGNYLDSANKGDVKNLAYADSVIQAAIDYGVYVIIDWHDHYAVNHTAKSVQFFQRMATKWGKYPNIIYEIYNEPMGAQAPTKTNPAGSEAIAWPAIEAYADTVVGAIRAIDTANLVLIPNSSWDQHPSEAIGSYLNDSYSNIAYTLHFYAGTHGTELRLDGNAALDAGLALFISEWGTTNADGGGGLDKKLYLTSTQTWLNWAKTNNLSLCNWSVMNKAESSAALLPVAGAKGWWPDSVLSPSGLWVRDQIRAANADFGYVYPDPPPEVKPDTASFPGRLQAEGFVNMSGIQNEAGGDDDGTDDVGYIDNGDWTDYVVKVASSGPFYFHARVASAGAGGNLILKSSTGTVLATVPVPLTGDWHTWTTVTDSVHPVTLPVGIAHLRLAFQGSPTATTGLFNVNWIELNDQLDGVLTPSRAKGLSWSVRGNVLNLGGLDRNWSILTVRDVRGKRIAQCALSGSRAQIELDAKGILFGEVTGPGGREVRKLVVGN